MVDARQLGLAFHMQRVNFAFQGQPDFVLGLAHPGEDAGLHVAAGGQHPPDLTPAHEVEPGAEIREVAQNGQVGIGLHRIADLQVHPGETTLQPVEIVRHRPRTVDIGRRAVELGDRRQIHGFTVQVGPGVMEMVHGRRGEKSVKPPYVASFPLKKPSQICDMTPLCFAFCSTSCIAPPSVSD